MPAVQESRKRGFLTAQQSLNTLPNEKPYKRIRDRLELKIPVRVRCRETPDFEWVEITRVVNITPFGAGFTLKRPTERGRILHLTIPMPRQLRVFDHVEDQYRIWALVRYVRNISKNPKEPVFEIGVAFIGKKPPASYEQDPSKRYDISQAQAQSAQLTSEMVAPITTSDQRAHTRHSIAVDLILEVLDEKNFVAQNEHSVTENLSKKGATIFTTMELPIGRFVRIRCDQYQITCFAVVRSKSVTKDGIPRIHVEFVDCEWPL